MALKWLRRGSNDDVEPNLQEFIAYFLMPIAADGRLAHYEETPLGIAQFVYGLDLLMARNSRATEGALREAIRAARTTAPPTEAWSPQEAWNSINRQSRRLTESQYWHVRVWLEDEARRLECPFDAGRRPNTFAEHTVHPTLPESLMRWIVTPLEDEAATQHSAAAPEAPSQESAAVCDEAPAGAEQYDQAVQQSPPSVPNVLEHLVCELPAEAIERLVCDVLREADLDGPCSRRADELVVGIERLLDADALPGLAFDEFRTGPDNQAVVVDRLPPSADVWFISDIHGDVLALRAAMEHIDTVSRRDLRQPIIVFLGDLFDRGHMGYQAVLQMFHELLVRGRQICLLAGNHDEALHYRDDEDAFVATVSPFELAEWLNDHRDELTRRVGRAVIRLFAAAPRAIFFPDGLVAAHGGVPLRDLADTFTCPADLDQPACLQDFVWTRAHAKARFKHINRHSRTCEFGSEDFEHFCRRAAEALDRPVERMIRGHDHVPDRFAFYKRYVRNPMLTINTLCYGQGDYGPHERMPCIGRYVAGHVPQVHQLRLPTEAIRRVYPPNLGADDDE